jgi:hypothetical protein
MKSKRNSWVFMPLAALSLVACSGESDSSGSSKPTEGKSTPSVLIEREIRWDDNQAYIRLIREVMQDCQQAKAEVARARGTSYDPRSEEITDEEILKLETGTTLEAFDGARYTEIKTVSALDRSRWGPGPDESCRPVAKYSKSVAIHPDACSVIEIQYDLDHGGGTRTEQKAACTPQAPTSDPAAINGERMAIDGTALFCRWSGPAGTLGRSCLLEPWLSYPGTDRSLTVAMQQAAPAAAVAAIQSAQQAVQASEHPIRVEVGKPLPAGIFDVPADARQFTAASGGAN